LASADRCAFSSGRRYTAATVPWFFARYNKGTPGPKLGMILEYDARAGASDDGMDGGCALTAVIHLFEKHGAKEVQPGLGRPEFRAQVKHEFDTMATLRTEYLDDLRSPDPTVQRPACV